MPQDQSREPPRKKRRVGPSEKQTSAGVDLTTLKFEKKNEDQKRLSPGATIRRRPMQHAPIGNPYAGASVTKVVYVSRNTPIMSAVKRVRKLLLQVEKRAMKNVKLVDTKRRDRETLNKIAEGSQKAKEEKIYVKATGVAMQQALRVAQWFREKEKEMLVDVEVTTGSVIVVDDIVEKEDYDSNETGRDPMTKSQATLPKVENLDDHEEDGDDSNYQEQEGNPTHASTMDGTNSTQLLNGDTNGDQEAHHEIPSANTVSKTRARTHRRRKKRPVYSEDDLPEARTRWVKMVEVAVSLKG